MTATWHGTLREYVDLTRVLSRNCACEVQGMGTGTRFAPCPAHQMLAEDQRALNGLLYGRRMAAKFQDEEWCATELKDAA
jgi:hypothetical protein